MDNEFLGGMLILFIIFYVVMILLSLAVAVLCIIAQWRLFEKAGEHGWAALIPIYNYFVMTKIATGNYLLGWIYMGICVVYTIVSGVSSFMLGFSSDSETFGFAYIMMMLVLFGLMIPVYVIAGYVSYMFSKSYGKPTLWNVCMIFLSPILMIVMGFDKNTYYVGPKGIPRNF